MSALYKMLSSQPVIDVMVVHGGCPADGVYSRDPDRCLNALVTMGVYLPTGDRTAVKRTADFFLSAFAVGERIAHWGVHAVLKAVEFLSRDVRSDVLVLPPFNFCVSCVVVTCPPQERLDTQAKEREEKGDAYSENFKPQRTKVGTRCVEACCCA
jgi:hypothetical protein